MTDAKPQPDPERTGEQPFPDETEWLDLTCPEVSDDFVENTWRRIAAIGSEDAEAEEQADPDSIELPRSLLDAYTVPEPSTGFVGVTWAATRAEAWQSALERHTVPEPSPDFVDRVLRSLREPALPLTSHQSRRPYLWIAAAAAVLAAVLLGVLVPAADDPSLPFDVLASHTFSPDTWAVAMSSLSDGGLAAVPDDPILRLGELAGLGDRR